MTNLEWLFTLSTDDLCKRITDHKIGYDGMLCPPGRDFYEKLPRKYRLPRVLVELDGDRT